MDDSIQQRAEELRAAVEQIRRAAEEGKISEGALTNLTAWLSQARYAQYVPQILEHIAAGKWQALDDAFWTIIPFGTGGRRGRMYPIGSNAINDRTIGESAQGLAEYVTSFRGVSAERSCAIAYDTRHNSRHFAELCASIMVANGFTVYFLDDFRATPQLSFAVRHLKCDCGIMVTASHNPPSDNAVKVYWSTGAQVLPPHDSAIIVRVMNAETIHTVEFQEALGDGRIKIVTEEIDREFLKADSHFIWDGSRDLKVIYSPLHGVGSFAVLPLLEAAKFKEVKVFGPHAEPNGDFPNVPGHVSNPENRAVFDAIIIEAKETGADLILATDPDCDRMGCAAPVTKDPAGEWRTLNGNQLGAILTDFILQKMKSLGKLAKESYVIKTLVTTELVRRIAEGYNVRCEGNIHVGFKWIAGLMDELGPDNFIFGTEESHGYMLGQFVRDKDAASACLAMCQLAADLKSRGKTLHERMDDLYREHGYHLEDLINVQMEGSEGMELMSRVMKGFRSDPPQVLGEVKVASVRDYASLTRTKIGGATETLAAPQGNMVILDLAIAGNYVAIRPSGTEPKIKFYFFTYLPKDESQDLAAAKSRMLARIQAIQADLKKYVQSVTSK